MSSVKVGVSQWRLYCVLIICIKNLYREQVQKIIFIKKKLQYYDYFNQDKKLKMPAKREQQFAPDWTGQIDFN